MVASVKKDFHHVKHMVDTLAKSTTKGPKEVLRKVEQMF
jgi:hypothetical protein